MAANATYSRAAQCEAELEDLQTENSRYTYHVLPRSFITANATHSMVAKYEAEMEGLQAENSRYAWNCFFCL